MKNKFKIGEIVIVKQKSEIHNKYIRAIGIIEFKDYQFNEYSVNILSQNKEEWFKEKDIEIIMERKIKKKDKYKVALAINIKGLEYINGKVKEMPNKHNNILNKVDFYKEFKVLKNRYAILVWTSTYWSESNFVVTCIQESLAELRKKNIAYKQVIIGETDPTYVKINEFIDNDSSVNIFNIYHKIELENVGGILI